MIKIDFLGQNNTMIEQVISLGDKNSKTLGLFPREAFYESAFRKQIIIAYQNNKLEGYLLYRVVKTKNKLAITHLCIDEAARGKGIAELLLNELIQKFGKAVRGIGLNCRKDYTKASDLWERFGFKPI